MEHKDLEAWKKSFDLAYSIYLLTNSFPENERYGLTQQIRRAAVSVPSNIAEGCGRATDKDTLRFIDIANGSIAELETQILLAQKLKYLNDTDILDDITETRKLLTGLKNYLKNK